MYGHAAAILHIIRKESAMHPSPAACADMSTADLERYRDELRVAMLDVPAYDDPFGPYRARVALIDAILADRKRNATLGACPNGHRDPIYVDENTAECAVCSEHYPA